MSRAIRKSDLDAARHFPNNYVKARENFRHTASELGAEIITYENPHKGPEGQDLCTDVAILGPREALNVLLSPMGVITWMLVCLYLVIFQNK